MKPSHTEITSVHDGLRKLNVLVASVAADIEKFLDAPEDFVASEYFTDVGAAANEAQHMVVTIRSLLKEEKWKPEA